MCGHSNFKGDSMPLRSKHIKRALVNSKFRFDVESFDLKFELKFGNSNESTNFPLKRQNSSLGVSAYLMMRLRRHYSQNKDPAVKTRINQLQKQVKEELKIESLVSWGKILQLN